MNERLKQLANQAGLSYLYDYDADGHAMVCSAKDIEKFAELIVIESCKTIESKFKYSNGTPLSFWEMSQSIQDLLKEHFGVKE